LQGFLVCLVCLVLLVCCVCCVCFASFTRNPRPRPRDLFVCLPARLTDFVILVCQTLLFNTHIHVNRMCRLCRVWTTTWIVWCRRCR
jgi:hypothetical protein